MNTPPRKGLNLYIYFLPLKSLFCTMQDTGLGIMEDVRKQN